MNRLVRQEGLFPVAGFQVPRSQRFKALERPLWTECKAALVARYLYYFVFITKHGTYIDAFAGRQSERADEGWAVAEVLKNEPAWLRKYHLFEKSPERMAELRALCARFPDPQFSLVRGDSNAELPVHLPVGSLKAREASFCLLDQRTFECHWSTCEHVAAIKGDGYKVEQFYFLAQGWLDRALSATTTSVGEAAVGRWWGRSDWTDLGEMSGRERASLMAERFRGELGYAEAAPWPIYERSGAAGRTMYYMIHATDHPEAPALMRRAYEWAVSPTVEDPNQLELAFSRLTY